MIKLFFLHLAKQLAFRGRTVESPRENHESTENVQVLKIENL